jgi:fibronectin type 3 domain-containing protein
MKSWTLATFFAVSLLILSGCVSSEPIPKEEALIDETLPLIELTEAGTVSDMKTIALEWKSIEDPRVRGIYIYRNKLASDDSDDNTYYDTINSRFSTHFVDNDVEPESSYSYYFITYSNDARSLPSKATVIETLPIMESVSWIYCVQNMPRSAKVLWRQHPNQKVKAYLIQRRTLKSDVWKDLKTVYGRLNVEYIDSNLEDKFTYKYRIKCLTYDGITSKSSKEVTIITKALPLEVQNITATTNLPKRIFLQWDKSKSEDFSHYNIYRSQDIESGYKIIKKIINNQYENTIEEDGARYFYQVSAVDKDGLESKHDVNSIKGKSLQKPLTPAIIEAKLIDGIIKIRWSVPDDRAVGYVVTKTYKKNVFNEINEEFEGVTDTEFIDKEIYIDASYSYIVYSVDVDGIRSEPSIEIKIKTPKSDDRLKQGTPKEIVVNKPKKVVVQEVVAKEVKKPVEKTVKKEVLKDARKDVVIINNDF